MTSIVTPSVTTLFNDEELEFRKKFSEYYPEIEIDNMDHDILSEMMFNVIQNEIAKDPSLQTKTKQKSPVQTIDTHWNEDIVRENAEVAEMLIPEMQYTQSLIHLKGSINNVPIIFMVDTGASMCVTHEYVIEKCGLHHLVDSNEIKHIMGAHSTEPTLGKIWCVDINLEVTLKDGSIGYVNIPITLDVTHDVVMPAIEESEKMKQMKKAVKSILNEPLDETKKCKHVYQSHDVILGMTFLRSYKVYIDFAQRELTLNGEIKLKFE